MIFKPGVQPLISTSKTPVYIYVSNHAPLHLTPVTISLNPFV
jgi:hypothetical protein